MADPIRVAVLDHFSGQDRDALVHAGADRFQWRVIPYWRFRNAANRLLPPEVQQGLSAWQREDLAPSRSRYATWLRRELARLYVESPFDVFVLPSDTYYYVRELPQACHELGIPVVVTQKETTITERFFAEHAPEVFRYAPFVSDRMTVCSERHRQFWIDAGSDGARIEVTGQPRFDVYADPPLPRNDRPVQTVLFLSYELDAYLLDSAEDWRTLRSETQSALFDAARAGTRLVVKLHPLQDRAKEEDELETVLKELPNVVLAAEGADTRALIRDADVVVGFQTTALYEAMAAGKPVAYTAWGALYEQLAPTLIPFETRPDLLSVVSSPADLTSWLEHPGWPDSAMHAARLAFIEEMLGPIDGHASMRTLDVISDEVERWSQQRALSRRRRTLGALGPPVGAALRVKRAASLALWHGLSRSARLLPEPARTRLGRSAEFRANRAVELAP